MPEFAIHAIVFNIWDYAQEKAESWLKDNGYPVGAWSEVDFELRNEQAPRDQFDPLSMKTIDLGGWGVKAVIGYLLPRPDIYMSDLTFQVLGDTKVRFPALTAGEHFKRTLDDEGNVVFKKISVTKEMLEEMDRNFDAFKADFPGQKIPFNIDHNGKFYAEVTDVEVVGDTMHADVDFSDGDEEVEEAIKKKHYRYSSAEIAPVADKTGKPIGLGLIGLAATNYPVDKTLGSPVILSEGLRKSAHVVAPKEGKMTKAELSALLGLKADASEEEVKKRITLMSEGSAFLDEVKKTSGLATKEEIADRLKKGAPKDAPGTITLSEKDWTDAQAKIEGLVKKNSELEAEGAVTAQFRKIPPASKEKFKKLYMSNRELFDELVDGLPDVVAEGVSGHGDRLAPVIPIAGEKVSEAMSERLDREVTKYMSEHNMTDYSAAMKKVLDLRPDLKREYAGNVRKGA